RSRRCFFSWAGACVLRRVMACAVEKADKTRTAAFYLAPARALWPHGQFTDSAEKPPCSRGGSSAQGILNRVHPATSRSHCCSQALSPNRPRSGGAWEGSSRRRERHGVGNCIVTTTEPQSHLGGSALGRRRVSESRTSPAASPPPAVTPQSTPTRL